LRYELLLFYWVSLIYSSFGNFSASIRNDQIISYNSQAPIDGKSHRSSPSNTGEIRVRFALNHCTELFFFEKIDLPIHWIYLDADWLAPHFHDKDQSRIKKPDELESILIHPPDSINENLLNSVLGSLIGLALGDALGAHVEFRPRQFLVEKPVTDLEPGGTWGLKRGQVFIQLLYLQKIYFICDLVHWWYFHGTLLGNFADRLPRFLTIWSISSL
jgi:hypothetical protein